MPRLAFLPALAAFALPAAAQVAPAPAPAEISRPKPEISSPLAASGSLWTGERLVDCSLVADRNGARVGDLVTVVIQLQTTATKDQKSSTSRKSELSDALKTFLFGRRTAQTGDQAFNFYRSGGEAPSMEWSADRSLSGGGKIDNKEAFTTTVTARVVEVAPNGVLTLEARRLYEAGKERSELVLTGFARREDISRANTLDSDRLADLSLKQVGSGPLSRDQKKGWLTRAYETVSPF